METCNGDVIYNHILGSYRSLDLVCGGSGKKVLAMFYITVSVHCVYVNGLVLRMGSL